MPTKKNIFIWQGYWQGGTGKVTLALAQYLQNKGVDVTLGVYTHNPKITLPQLVFTEPLWLPSSFRSLYTSAIWHIKHSSNYGLVYAHTLGVWKTKHNHLFIHDAADFDQKLHSTPDIFHALAYYVWRTLYFNLCFQRATLIFAATDALHQFLRRNNVDENKIVRSASFFNDSTFTFRSRPQPQKPYKVVFIGDTSDPAKNLPYMVQHFYKNNDYLVSILGGKEEKSDHNFTYHGYREPTFIKEILDQSDFFIMPSRSEGFSIALLEAAATGIPCLVNKDAMPVELENVPNMIPFSPDAPIHQIITQTTKKYTYYSQEAAEVKKYAQSHILKKEYEAIAPYLA